MHHTETKLRSKFGYPNIDSRLLHFYWLAKRGCKIEILSHLENLSEFQQIAAVTSLYRWSPPGEPRGLMVMARAQALADQATALAR
jgi:hypothetical protein